MLPKIDIFIECLKDYNFLTVFDKWETYLWSNFPINSTGDIDITFIGEPSEELAEKILDFQKYVKETYEMKIDEQVFENTDVFSYIPQMNISDFEFNNIFKYKINTHLGPRKYKSDPIKINKYFWKYELSGMGEKNKFRLGKLNIHYPILIKDFLQLYFNIKNPHIYNTIEDNTFNKMKKLRREYYEKIVNTRNR